MYILWIKIINIHEEYALDNALTHQQYPSTGADDGLAPTRRQAIIWTNDR